MRYRTSTNTKQSSGIPDYAAPPMQYLEHGNYKLFGCNKSKAGITNKFLMSAAKDQRSARTAANSTFLDTSSHINTKHYNLNHTAKTATL